MSIKVDVFIIDIKEPPALIQEYKEEFYLYYRQNGSNGNEWFIGDTSLFAEYMERICADSNTTYTCDCTGNELASNYISNFFHCFMENAGYLGDAEPYSLNITNYREYQEYLKCSRSKEMLEIWKYITEGRPFHLHGKCNPIYEYGWTVGYWNHSELKVICRLLHDLRPPKHLARSLKTDLEATARKALTRGGSVLFLSG